MIDVDDNESKLFAVAFEPKSMIHSQELIICKETDLRKEEFTKVLWFPVWKK